MPNLSVNRQIFDEASYTLPDKLFSERQKRKNKIGIRHLKKIPGLKKGLKQT
jgi:hypothetical protein